MSRNSPRTALAVVAMSLALVAAACGSDTKPPSPTAVPTTVARASIVPTPAATATPNQTPAVSPTQTVIGPGAWATTGSMLGGRPYGATATVLQDGRVLVAGGDLGSGATELAEVYDPGTGRWTATGRMHYPRRGLTSTLLADGRVLVTGGWSLSDHPTSPPVVGELYDSKSGRWSKTGAMTRWRYSPSAIELLDGRVLVLGGYTSSGGFTRRAEIFDPTSATWRATRSMAAPAGPSALLTDGRVLVVHADRPPEAFDPTIGKWRGIASPPVGPSWDVVVRLTDGRVLLLAFASGDAQLYDPVDDVWTAANGPHTGRGRAALLADGTVLVVGKVSSARFDPASGSWSAVPRPPLPRDYALDSIDGVEVDQLARLLDGKILATEIGAAAVYDPTAGG